MFVLQPCSKFCTAYASPARLESRMRPLWRQASLPDVEGGILAARNCGGESSGSRMFKHLGLPWFFPPGWEARHYGSLGWPPPRGGSNWRRRHSGPNWFLFCFDAVHALA